MKYQNLKMETKQKLKVGDKIVCITDSYKDFTKGKEYEIFEINSEDFTCTVLDDDGIKTDFTLYHFDKNFKLKKTNRSCLQRNKRKTILRVRL